MRPLDKRIVPAAFLRLKAVAEIRGQPFIHPRLAVAVGADHVVPPLVADFMGYEIVHKGPGKMRHAEDALVDHHQAGALIAVPAEVRLGDGELVVGIRTEPLAVRRNRLAGDADHLLRIVLVLRKGQHSNADGPRLAGVFLVAVAAQDGEITGRNGREVHLPPAVSEVPGGDHRRRTRELLVGRQRDADTEDAGLIEERLVPGDERRRLPAAVVVHRQHREPVGEEGHALPLPPAALVWRQFERIRNLDRDGFVFAHRFRQRHDQRRQILVVIVERQVRCS